VEKDNDRESRRGDTEVGPPPDRLRGIARPEAPAVKDEANAESRGRDCIVTLGSARAVARALPPTPWTVRRPAANGASGPDRLTTNSFLADSASRPPETAKFATRTPRPNWCRGTTVHASHGSKNPRCPRKPLSKKRLTIGRL
jgi:hypothetical protein